MSNLRHSSRFFTVFIKSDPFQSYLTPFSSIRLTDYRMADSSNDVVMSDMSNDMPGGYPANDHQRSDKRPRLDSDKQNPAQASFQPQQTIVRVGDQANSRQSVLSTVNAVFNPIKDAGWGAKEKEPCKPPRGQSVISSLQAQNERINELTNSLEQAKGDVRDINRAVQKKHNHVIRLREELHKANKKYNDFNQTVQEEFRKLKTRLHHAHGDGGRSTTQDLSATTALQVELQETREELAKAQEENNQLAVSLEECKDQIFSMQPDQQPSDQDICERYDSLCNAVGQWVDTQVGDGGGLLTPSQVAALTPTQVCFLQGFIARDFLEHVDRFPRAETSLVETLIHGLLYDKILESEQHCLGIPSAAETFLNKIDEGLKRLGSAKGKVKKIHRRQS